MMASNQWKAFTLLGFALFISLVDGFSSVPPGVRFLRRRQSVGGLNVVKAEFRRTVFHRHFLTSLKSHDTSATKEESVPLEHRGVPSEHQGLHSSLYGDGDDHGASEQESAAEIVLNDVKLPVEKFLSMSKGKKVAGVFAVFSAEGVVKFVSFSRNLHMALASISNAVGAAECAVVRVQTFRFPKRDELQLLQQRWVSDAGGPPPGNVAAASGGDPRWEEALRDMPRGADEAERRAQEEKKLKLRKAMADPSLIDELPQLSDEDKYRRYNLNMAVAGDDWSGEIDRQTADTVAPAQRAAPAQQAPKTAAAAVPAAAVVSPFQGSGSGAGDGGGEELAFTIENVDRVLDEVISVAPSAADSAGGGLTVELIESLLAPVRPAVQGLGGSLKVLGADGATGAVTLEYKGPAKLTYGLELTLKENPLIRSVVFV